MKPRGYKNPPISLQNPFLSLLIRWRKFFLIEGKKNGTDQKKRPSIKIKKKRKMCAERKENLRCVYVSSSPSISFPTVDDFDWRMVDGHIYLVMYRRAREIFRLTISRPVLSLFYVIPTRHTLTPVVASPSFPF